VIDFRGPGACAEKYAQQIPGTPQTIQTALWAESSPGGTDPNKCLLRGLRHSGARHTPSGSLALAWGYQVVPG
jgi:hypothetical protein